MRPPTPAFMAVLAPPAIGPRRRGPGAAALDRRALDSERRAARVGDVGEAGRWPSSSASSRRSAEASTRRRVGRGSVARGRGWWTHGLPPVGITLIARCLRRSGVDAVPATGAGERVDERPVGRGRSPATFAAQAPGVDLLAIVRVTFIPDRQQTTHLAPQPTTRYPRAYRLLQNSSARRV